MAKSGKLIKKTFFDVKSSLVSSKISLYGATKEEMIGKTVNLDLTRILRGKNLEFKMKVKLEGDSLVGEPVSLNLAGAFIRRMMRKGSDYVEDSFVTSCKDGNVIIKPFLITRNKVSRTVRNLLRVNTRKYLEGYLKARTTKEVFSDIMSNKIQKELSFKLKKIYPLALCEIRVFEITNEKVAEVKEEIKEEPKTEEKKEEKAEKTKKAKKE
jgi:ribosomal protein S3AE